MKYLRFLVIMMFAAAIAFTACGGSSGGGGSRDGDGRVTTTFEAADTNGDVVPVTVGSDTVYMIYANNQTNIIFPFSPSSGTPVDNNKATLTRKFFMGETQVTNALMVEVLNWAKANNKISEAGTDNLVSAATVKYGNQELLDLDYGTTIMKISYSTTTHTFSVAAGYEDYPVVCVTWYGAIMFCNWLTEMRDGAGITINVVYTGIDTDWLDTETVENADRNGYRLPSSEEWEYAARYIGTTAPTGNTLSSEYIAKNVRDGHADLTDGYCWTPASYPSGGIDGGFTGSFATDYSRFSPYGWYGNSTYPYGNTISLKAVGQKTANQLGLYDMSGNVFEWCFTASGSYRVRRGGGWGAGAELLQVGIWIGSFPYVVSSHFGFRFARTQ